eukprot:m.310044 g.310044  ORF g.310044 m.310044 type:complete len:505 (+) comp49274_c0_seq1:59-1573(+)
MSIKVRSIRSSQRFSTAAPSVDPISEEENDEEIQWNPYLYQLQKKAPRPCPVPCRSPTPNRPDFYGSEFHGSITRNEAASLLNTNGSFLVRSSQTSPGEFSLSLNFESQIKHFKLFYDDQQHYVGEKRFETMHDLIEDGLIAYYVEAHAKAYIDLLPVEGRKYATISKKKAAKLPIVVASDDPNAYHEAGVIFRHSVSLGDAARRKEPKEKPTPVRKLSEAARITNNLGLSPRVRTRTVSDVPSFYEKAHAFKVATFHGPYWCDFCRNFMWGLRAQGVRCQDCGFQCHKHCSGFADKDCQPDAKRVKRVFGVDLTTVTKVYGTRRPIVLEQCVREIEKRGLDEEGLYRVPGFADDITAVKKAFDKEGKAEIGHKQCADINVVAGVLKQYLRELPIPVVTFEAYPKVLDALQKDTEATRVYALRMAIQSLPKPHFNTLQFVVDHLERVANKSSTNLMLPNNLGIVFGPTLMRSETTNPVAALADVPLQKNAVALMIQYAKFVFEG